MSNYKIGQMNAKREEEVAAKIKWEKKEDAINVEEKVISKEIALRDRTVEADLRAVVQDHILQEAHHVLIEEKSIEEATETEKEVTVEVKVADQGDQPVIDTGKVKISLKERTQDLLILNRAQELNQHQERNQDPLILNQVQELNQYQERNQNQEGDQNLPEKVKAQEA
jgi:hypothetical protein